VHLYARFAVFSMSYGQQTLFVFILIRLLLYNPEYYNIRYVYINFY